MNRTGHARRLAQLESPAAAVRRGGIVLLPPIMDLNEWEAIAVPQQERLAAATHLGIDGAPVAPAPVAEPDRPFWSKAK